MKKLIIIIFSSLLFIIQLSAQIPVSTTVNDQIVQGPCFLFAVVAALESKVLESNPDINSDFDLYEWNLYSCGILDGKTANGTEMITKVLEHANEIGVHSSSGNLSPSSINDLPNINDPFLPGIACFDVCDESLASGDFSYISQPGEGICLDEDEKEFSLEGLIGNKFIYQASGNLFKQQVNPTVEKMKNAIDNGHGLVAFFENWGPNLITHAIYIHGYSGNLWRFKDSHPGDAGLKIEPLNINNCISYLFLTGTIESALNCNGSQIEGPSSVTNATTYNLNSGADNASNISWSVTNNLVKIYENDDQLVVLPDNCEAELGLIEASFSIGELNCNVSKTVSVEGGSNTPESILVLSPNWNNGKTCPNTTLELNVIDNNPSYPLTTFEWNIQGASLISGQGTPTAFVITPDYPTTSFLTFKVRAKYGDCSYSNWVTIHGKSSPENCEIGDGGNGPFFKPIFEGQFMSILNMNSIEDHSFKLVSLDGKIIQEGRIDKFESKFNINAETSSLLVLIIEDQNGQVIQVSKHIFTPRSSGQH